MAVTAINTNLREMAWGKTTWMEAKKQTFFEKFTGTEEPGVGVADKEAFNSIVIRKTELARGAGDRIQIRLLYQLKGAGVTGDSTLEGNEEGLDYTYQNLTVDQLRHGVRLKGRMEDQKTSLNLRSDAKSALKMWWANVIDQQIVDALVASPTSSATIADNRTLYGGDATSTATLEANDVMTTDVIDKCRIQAEESSPIIRPIMWNGNVYYVLLVRSYQIADLRKQESYRQALQNAWWQGEKNPLFAGADCVWNGVVVHAFHRIPILSTGGVGGDIPYGQALLLGAGAVCYAIGNAGGGFKKTEMDWNEETFDYKNQVGFEAGMIFEIAKTVFDSKDFAAISAYTSYTAIL